MKNTKIMKNLLKSGALALTIFYVSLTMACKGLKTDYIFVIDLSESVSAKSRENSFEAIKTRAKLLKRGDTLTVIPVTADAQVEASGNVLQLAVGENRELADADLEAFYALADKKLKEMRDSAKSYHQTDLIGTWRVVGEAAALAAKPDRRLIIAVFSDLVHSTGQVRFESSPIFGKSETARRYAAETAKKNALSLSGAEVYLGLLESTDLQKMSGERREAVRVFWQEYLQKSGARRCQFSTDGTGQFEKFMNSRDGS